MQQIQHCIAQDIKHIWHPCMRMKDFETCPPLVVHGAQGCYLHTDQGKIIDGISSWWCKSLGHQHPVIIQAMQQQLQRFTHVITANTTNSPLAALGENLARITGNQHVYFAADGSCAVEIAMKLALHAMQIRGEPQRRQFIALTNGYHGETMACLSVSDLGLYKKPYAHFCQDNFFLNNIPYVTDRHDPVWHDCEEQWNIILPHLEAIESHCCAIILEPIVQGAGGMLIYSADFLKRLAIFAKTKGIYLIADEIMTGMGRLGKWLACHYADVQPDLICLSKGLTAGNAPLSATVVSHELYEIFYHLKHDETPFLHSHTYTGHPLGVAAANAVIDIIEQEHILQQAEMLGEYMVEKMRYIAEKTAKLTKIRYCGAIVAADLVNIDHHHAGKHFHQIALKNGALLRPLGNTIYWLPPLNARHTVIDQLADVTLKSIQLID